jgi:hypothetical protein
MMLDLIVKNRTLITQIGSMIAGLIVAICNLFPNVHLTSVQKESIDTIGGFLCIGLICLENYVQNREHKSNVKKIEGGK